jgi:hypothetical protein
MVNEDITLVLAGGPADTDPRYFQTWQRVSVALQRALRAWIPETYFRDDVARYEDRDAGYPLVAYEACRVCYGRPRTEFTYDVADPETMAAALRAIGRAMQDVLERIEKRLYQAGRPQLARRYAPVWHQDILVAVRRKPKRMVRLLANEAKLINAAIDFGTMLASFKDQSQAARFAAGKRYSHTAGVALRTIYHMNMLELSPRVLDETARVLKAQPDAADHIRDLLHSGVPENLYEAAARSPNAGIG